MSVPWFSATGPDPPKTAGWRCTKIGEWEHWCPTGFSTPSPLMASLVGRCAGPSNANARVVIKESSSEAPWALHPLGNVVFVGERWLAENGLLPMDFAMRDGNVAGF